MTATYNERRDVVHSVLWSTLKRSSYLTETGVAELADAVLAALDHIPEKGLV